MLQGGIALASSMIKTLITEEELQKRIKELGQEISRDYKDKNEPIILISILKGALPFTADLMRAIDVPVQLEVLVASSYGAGTSTSGRVEFKYKSFGDLEGCHVILVDDIIDSGYTLEAIGRTIGDYNPLSVAYCTCLSNVGRRESDIQVNYNGFDIPNKFVIGYGLDYNQKYRELPFIGYLDRGE